MKIQPGTDIGRYHILEQLGEGGMALVYKAYDTRLESEAAIKFIRVDDFPANALPRILKRFQIEARKMAQLQHPNIVKVTDFGEYQGVPYLVMEYLPGGSLKSRLGKPIPWQEAVKLILPIADALAYAHSKGLIHRDVKPGNILITESGQPMLSDFGVAKVLDPDETLDLTMTGIGIGTPEYMAPEIGLQKEFDHRADIYSLGVVLYEMVTGRKPFTADTPMAVMFKHFNDPLPDPRGFSPDLPDMLTHILFKTLVKDPKDRYADMGEVILSMEKLDRSYGREDLHTKNKTTSEISISTKTNTREESSSIVSRKVKFHKLEPSKEDHSEERIIKNEIDPNAQIPLDETKKKYSSIFKKILGVLTFRKDVYKVAANDETFDPAAWVIVSLSALGLGIFQSSANLAFNEFWVINVVLGTISWVAGFGMSVMFISWIVKAFLKMEISKRKITRVLGLASIWIIFNFVGLIMLLISWFIAIKETLELKSASTWGTVIPGWLSLILVSWGVNILFAFLLVGIGNIYL